jgi:hypothetical protein
MPGGPVTALTPAAVASRLDHAAGHLVRLLTPPTILVAGFVLGVIAERAGWVR